MCLAVPGRIVTLLKATPLPSAIVDFGGVTKCVCLAYTPDARVDDYVLVHVGFAISVLDANAAEQTLAYLDMLEEPERSS